MTEGSGSAGGYPDYPSRLYRPADASSRLRQGDLALGHFHQLRTAADVDRPGPAESASAKVPYFREYEDVEVAIGARSLVLRVWTGWVMVVAQSCEFQNADPNDSRLLVAPVVFRPSWDGDHWPQIINGTRPAYLFLSPMPPDQRGGCGKAARAWPDAEAAACLANTTLVTPGTLIKASRFSISREMQHVLQQRLVTFWSVREWMRERHVEKALIGKRIARVEKTDEYADGPAKLYKVFLENGDDDEATFGIIVKR